MLSNAENLWLHMHTPHYGLTEASQYLGKAEMDGWMGREGGGGNRAGIGGWVDEWTEGLMLIAGVSPHNTPSPNALS